MSTASVAKSPPPFPAPKLLPARRVMGTVLTAASENGNAEPSSAQAPDLERSPSMAGNILLVEEGGQQGESRTKPFLLHRKIKTSLHGYVRLGFILRETKNKNVWQLVPNHQDLSSGVASGQGAKAAQEQEEDSFQMVAIKIESKSPAREESLVAELAALQWIATNDPSKIGGLLVPTVLAEDEANSVYTITPYQKKGSLFDYCAKVGTLSESEAKTFFGKMLEGLDTLQQLGLCHRNLSLEHVLLEGTTTCTFAHLQNALRIPTTEDGRPCHVEPQPPMGTMNPQYVAPELLKQLPFDGFAVDLWSTAIMLFLMLLGKEALFDAPVPEDKKFHEICIQGDLKGALKRWGKQDDIIKINNDALDLLQGLLRGEPSGRLTLAQVKAHPWMSE